LLASAPGGVQQELATWGSPAAKVILFFTTTLFRTDK